MRREDLRIVEWRDSQIGDGTVPVHRKLTDADLASLGYVKLDGIDVQRLRRSMALIEEHQTGFTIHSVSTVSDLVRKVLAAIDQEDTP